MGYHRALAQLAERSLDKRKVGGSNPPSPIFSQTKQQGGHVPANRDIPSKLFKQYTNWREGVDFGQDSPIKIYQDEDLGQQQEMLRFGIEFPDDGDTEMLVRRRIAEFEEQALWGDDSFIDVGSINDALRLDRVENWYEYTTQSEFK